MPCYDPDTHNRPIRLENKVHFLTSLLCHACERLSPAAIAANPKLAAWWEEHKTHDTRIATLKQKRDRLGFGGLTPEERGTLLAADDVSY